MPNVRRRARPGNRRPRRRVARRRGAGRVRRTRLNPMTMGCKIIEVEEFNATGANVGGIVTAKLADYARALKLSASYKYYRCEKVEVEFIPRFNTFQGSDAGISKPELYYQTNKQLLQTAPTKAIMQARGCSPIQWTKTIKKSFNPAIIRGESLYTFNGNVGVLASFSDGTSFAVAQISPAAALFGPTGGTGTLSGIVNGQSMAVTTGNPARYAFYEAQTPVHGKWYATQSQALPASGTITAGVNPGIPGANPTNLTYYGAEFFITVPGSESDSAFISGRIVVKTTWGFKGARAPTETNASYPPN